MRGVWVGWGSNGCSIPGEFSKKKGQWARVTHRCCGLWWRSDKLWSPSQAAVPRTQRTCRQSGEEDSFDPGN